MNKQEAINFLKEVCNDLLPKIEEKTARTGFVAVCNEAFSVLERLDLPRPDVVSIQHDCSDDSD